MRPRIGALFQADRPVAQLAGAARRAEHIGFDEFWLAEDCFMHGGLTAAATVLGTTSRLSVGLGLLPALVRNPAILAMELATLAELYPGRLQVALGHGVTAWMAQIGIAPADRTAALEEVLVAVRRLLAGQEHSVQGRAVRLERVALEFPPAVPPPLLIGTTGPRGIQLAASMADGLLLPEGAGDRAITAARQAMGERRTVVTYAWLRIDDDGEAARVVLRDAVERWRDWGLYPGLMEHSGLPPAGVAIELGDLDRIAVVGTPLECARGLRRLAAAGASTVVLLPVGDDPDRQLEQFADRSLPLVLADSLS